MEIFNSLTYLDLSNIKEFHTLTKKVLIDLASDKEIFRLLLNSVAENSYLLSLTEHHDVLDKVVLYEDASRGIRIRLHVYLEEYSGRPHNHTWPLSSLILHGGYQHHLYGDGKDWNEDIDIEKLRPLMIREEKVGSMYTLDPDTVHSISTQPYTISLVVITPHLKERFLVVDKKKDTAFWQYVVKHKMPTEMQNKSMSLSYFNSLVSKIDDFNLI
ncbi:hypothetical protein [Nostoc sp. PA-18-2419]|uniref:hypothetical protein n=1 Tax=Nostoc sp. PA-18-2419 TaxID=2575443 RepID=UPI001109C207|nr:hypothetical protein [Nostoc sp. PA-18-2419]